MPLNLPYTQQSAAYQWFADRLRYDPQLRQAIAAGNLVTRIPGSSSDDDEVTLARCPWVRLTPAAEPTTPFAKLGPVLIVRAPVLVQIECATAGYDPRDFERLALAIHGAILPYMADIAATASAGISAIECVQVPSGIHVPADSGSGLIVGLGSYRLILNV